MTIDLSKPIRRRDGREAKYLGELPDDRAPFAFAYMGEVGSWIVNNYDQNQAERLFENIPPSPPQLKGFCPVSKGLELGHSRSRQDCMKYYPDSEWLMDASTLTDKNFVWVGS